MSCEATSVSIHDTPKPLTNKGLCESLTPQLNLTKLLVGCGHNYVLAACRVLTIKLVTPFLKSAIVLSRSNWSIPEHTTNRSVTQPQREHTFKTDKWNSILNMQGKNRKHHRKVLLSSSHLNSHTLGFDPQTQKLGPPCTA